MNAYMYMSDPNTNIFYGNHTVRTSEDHFTVVAFPVYLF